MEVYVKPHEPRYWVMMISAILLGYLLVKLFDRIPKEKKSRSLKVLGLCMILLHGYIPVSQILDPDYAFSVHRNLPLHFCALNFWLIAFNCFIRSRILFIFTIFMGFIGCLHSFLTPLLFVGDSLPLVVHYTIVHSSLVSVPVIMMRHFNMEIKKYDWIRAFGFDFTISAIMIGVNYLLNTYVDNPLSDPANYMYVSEMPNVDNPLLPKSFSWPMSLIPLYTILAAHILVVNRFILWCLGIKVNSFKEFFH